MLYEANKRIVNEYRYKSSVTGGCQATIIFVNNEFEECQYSVKRQTYDYGDWMFLKEVAIKIQELQEEIKK